MAANRFLVTSTGTVDGLASVQYIGPFDTGEAAQAHAEEHNSSQPLRTASVQPLIDPANC